MPPLHFESLTSSLMRLPDVIKSVPDVIRNPAANPLQAAILLAMLLVVLLIVLLSVVLLIMRPSAEDELLFDEETEGGEEEDEQEERWPPPGLAWLTTVGLVILVLTAVWVATGITSGVSDVCGSCHTGSLHASATVEDPHRGVACVRCHEGGGAVARVTVNLATRVMHIVYARTGSDRARSYGRPIASDGCLDCHKTQLNGVYHNTTLGVRVSHKEPLAAGAQCVDCHALKSGIVSASTIGMEPCLRCHDGTKAKAGCETCHDGDPAVAITPDTPTDAMASAQVPNPQCNGCHTDMTTCDNCHGIRMPHSVTFKLYAHARDAVIDIWYGTGKQCQRCHYTGHNDCTQVGCHINPPSWGHPNPAWAKLHQRTSWSKGPQTGCSCHAWNPYDHGGMIYCQICHPTKPANAVP